MESIQSLYIQENNTPFYLKIWVVYELVDKDNFKLKLYYSDWPYEGKELTSTNYEGTFDLALVSIFLTRYSVVEPHGLTVELKSYWRLLMKRLIHKVDKDALKINF